MNPIIKEIREQLEKQGSEEVLLSTMRFFKESIQAHGLKNGDVEKIAKKYLPLIKTLPKFEVFSICEELWKSNYIEEGFIACHFSYAIHKQYTIEDIKIFEYWINNYITNWATCDTFCNHTVGDLIMMYPDKINTIKQWTQSKNRWMKRASAVSLIVPAKKGLFLTDVFEIAETLLLDSDDMVQKGYGWMLKVAANKHEQEVFDFVNSRKKTMPRTALRYAIEKMPPALKMIAMEK
jgi:3-methyladenine DNA glycosylase AlkD